jgi:DNA-binding transcriptional ArsR family regulator
LTPNAHTCMYAIGGDMRHTKYPHIMYGQPKHHQLIVLALLKHDLSRYYPTVEQLSEDSGLGIRTVERTLSELKNKTEGVRLVIKKKQTRGGTINRYLLLGVEDDTEEPEEPELDEYVEEFRPQEEYAEDEVMEFLLDVYESC